VVRIERSTHLDFDLETVAMQSATLVFFGEIREEVRGIESIPLAQRDLRLLFGAHHVTSTV
jgi:hypothetical protein